MEEVVIADGPLEVVVLPEAGARLHRLRAFGHDVLLTPDDPATHLADPFFWGAYVMAPWCNRIEARPTRIGAREVDLASNFPDGTAIHGQVYARPWTARWRRRIPDLGRRRWLAVDLRRLRWTSGSAGPRSDSTSA